MTLTEFCDQPLNKVYTSEALITVPKTESLADAIDMMATKNIGALIIVEHGVCVGIFTERDVLRKIVGKISDLAERQIGEFMTPSPIAAPLTVPVSKVLAVMRIGRFRHLILKNEDGALHGIISVRDVVALIADFMALRGA